MRIVQAIETGGPGGAEQVLIRLCALLSTAGHDVRPLLLKDGWLRATLESQGFPVEVLPLTKPLDPSFVRLLGRFLSKTRPHVFHSHEITFALYGRLASHAAQIAHVATAHGRNFSKGLKRRVLGTLLLRGGRRFRLAAVSGVLADDLARDFHTDRRRLAVVPNGIEFPPEVAATSRRPGEPLRLVAVGNLYPVKNHALLVEAVSVLRRTGIDVELDVLGRGEEEGRLRRKVADLGLEKVVRLRGFVSDVDAHLSHAHVLVSSSLSEAMPISFLEAMARGLPVVASRVGGVPEIVEHGAQGLLFGSGSVAEAAAAVARLAKDEPLRIGLGRRARARVRESYGAPRMVESYLGIYRELAS